MTKNIQTIGFWELTRRTYLSISRPLFLFYISLVFALLLHWAFWIPATIMVLDVRARLSDFIRFRKIEYSARMAELLQKSWCKRGVAQAIWPEAQLNYRAKGYRIYHILPDGAPRVFFKLRFWEAVIGTKHPKGPAHW